jgi:hypothetical protein
VRISAQSSNSIQQTAQVNPGSLFVAAFVLACLACPALPAAEITNTQVVVDITTATSSPISAGFSGYNAPQLRNGVEYYDPKFVNVVTPLLPGWLRFPAGTASMAYDWNPQDASGGHINIAWMDSLIDGNPPEVTGTPANVLEASQPLTQAKGGVYLSDFATFAKTFGAKAIICFNGYTDTNPGSATLMAQAAQNAGVNVIDWELANEAYLYPIIFPSADAYAAAMYNPYFTGIESATPNATVGVFIAGLFTGSQTCPTEPSCVNWDTTLSAYTPRYWSSVSMHVYPIGGIDSPSNSIEILNGILAHATSEYISSYVDPLVGADTPIFITELNCCAPDSNQFLSFLYNGIFLAEYIVRMSAVPNVKAVGINSLYTDSNDYHGMIQAGNSETIENYLMGQVEANPTYSTDTATNPNTQFQFYTSAPGLAMEVANKAINNSTAIWPTTVTGGPLVPIQGYGGQAIPAVYAQGYQGTGGTDYVVITNKSPATCTTTIQINGKRVSGQLNVTTVSSASALVANTATAPNTVQIKTTTSTSPVSIGPYSVTVVNW